MARRSNYSQEKRLKELERQKKKEKKTVRKLEREKQAPSLEETAGPVDAGTGYLYEPD